MSDTLSGQEAADLLCLSRQRVDQLRRAGELEAVRKGGRWLYDRAAVEALAARRAEGGASATASATASTSASGGASANPPSNGGSNGTSARPLAAVRQGPIAPTPRAVETRRQVDEVGAAADLAAAEERLADAEETRAGRAVKTRVEIETVALANERARLELEDVRRKRAAEEAAERSAKAAVAARAERERHETAERERRERSERSEREYATAVQATADLERIRVRAEALRNDPSPEYAAVIDAALALIPATGWINFARIHHPIPGAVQPIADAHKLAAGAIYEAIGAAGEAFYRRRSAALEASNAALRERIRRAEETTDGAVVAIHDIRRMM